jgi:hypothetical protein
VWQRAKCNDCEEINHVKPRAAHVLLLVALVPSGLWVKFGVNGPLAPWCHLYGAAVLYEAFWVLLLGWIAPRLGPWRCAAVVLLVTCLLEALQLWHPPALEAVRATRAGAALIGTAFDPWDFPHYLAGSLLGALALIALRARVP